MPTKQQEAVFDVDLDEAVDEDFVPAIERLRQELLTAAETLTSPQARFLVDAYYAAQLFRIQARGQMRDASEAGEPAILAEWVGRQFRTLENAIRRVLDRYSEQHIAGRWAKSLVGVGPVISAGLLAHVDIARCYCTAYQRLDERPAHDCPGMETVGHLWSFGGVNPEAVWERGVKRPWNARLKVLIWKIGQSFMKHRNRKGDFYGKLYEQRKAYEVERNLRGGNAKVAAETLAKKNIRNTEVRRVYQNGQLPDGRIELRAERWAAKIFLAHWHHVSYFARYQKHPPKPYVMAILGHTDEIQVPNWPFNP